MTHPLTDKEREILTRLIDDTSFQQMVARDPINALVAEGLSWDDAESLVRELIGGDEVSGYKQTPDAGMLVRLLVRGAEAKVLPRVVPDDGKVLPKVLPDDGKVLPKVLPDEG